MIPHVRPLFRHLARWGAFALGLGVVASDAEPAFSYRRDIRQILSRAGCNAGPCHGNANGKGGFKLSLRGEDPAADHTAITREQAGRRVDPLAPGSSLLLLKATASLAHEGGQRFGTNSWEYRTLHDWIAAGAPDDRDHAPVLAGLEVTPRNEVLVAPRNGVGIRATAVFADGSRRDVTREAVFELTQPVATVDDAGRVTGTGTGETVVLVRYLDRQVPVRLAFVPQRSGYAWDGPEPAGFIDRHIFAKLRELRLNPSGECSDGEFIRRVSLDLTGLLPTAAEARAFVSDPAPDKRSRLVDRLLETPAFADFWALKWADLLRVEERGLDRKGMDIFHRWLRAAIREDRPLDEFTREILTARGSTYVRPPANFYRANRTPVDRALAVAQVFLGTRLNCAQCHNHPFDRWSQDDYHDWAAVFARVDYKVLRNDRRDDNDSHEFIGEQVVYLAPKGEVPNPRTGTAARPRLLGREAPMDTGAAGDELAELAGWLTAHPQFARVQANRIWYHLLGRGLVDPIDDFRDTNPASHPELLEELAADFAAHGFRLRHTLRRILDSRTYRLSSDPGDAPADASNHTHAAVRRLTAEQLVDIQHQVLGVPLRVRGYPEGIRAAQLPGALPTRDSRKSDLDRFLEVFGKPARLLTCECERSDETTMAQAFQLISGPSVHALLSAPDNRLGRWIRDGRTDDQVIDELFWSALTRGPSDAERVRCRAHLEGASDRRAALEDLAWGVLNAKEFILRH